MYARTTVATFIMRLIEKEYISTYKIGRIAYIHVIATEQEYIEQYVFKKIDFWLNGDINQVVKVLQEIKKEKKSVV